MILFFPHFQHWSRKITSMVLHGSFIQTKNLQISALQVDSICCRLTYTKIKLLDKSPSPVLSNLSLFASLEPFQGNSRSSFPSGAFQVFPTVLQHAYKQSNSIDSTAWHIQGLSELCHSVSFVGDWYRLSIQASWLNVTDPFWQCKLGSSNISYRVCKW